MLLRLLSRTTRRISFHPLVLGLTFAYFFFNVLRNILLLLSFSNVQDPQLGHCTFSIAYFSMASKATSIACCCISSVCHESQACRRYNAGEVCATMSADLTCALIVVIRRSKSRSGCMIPSSLSFFSVALALDLSSIFEVRMSRSQRYYLKIRKWLCSCLPLYVLGRTTPTSDVTLKAAALVSDRHRVKFHFLEFDDSRCFGCTQAQRLRKFLRTVNHGFLEGVRTRCST